jgi:hypothetical protein
MVKKESSDMRANGTSIWLKSFALLVLFSASADREVAAQTAEAIERNLAAALSR